MSVDILDRMKQAVAKVRERLLRATSALNQAKFPYAVVGGNAVASWVATIDEGAVRNTRDVDVLIRRDDLQIAGDALQAVGFIALENEHEHATVFRDAAGSNSKVAVRLLFTGERTRPDHLLPAPPIETVDDPANFPVIALDSLVLMKLLPNRAIDASHLRDMVGVGLIDASWPVKFPSELAERLQYILDTPDG